MVLMLVLFVFRCVGEGVRDEGWIFQKIGFDVRPEEQLILVSFVCFSQCVLSLSSVVLVLFLVLLFAHFVRGFNVLKLMLCVWF